MIWPFFFFLFPRILTYLICEMIQKQFYFKYIKYFCYVFDLYPFVPFVFAVFHSAMVVISELGGFSILSC